MGIGVLNLVNTGKENLYMSYNPEITFFKISYKRYSNYSIEQVPQFFKSRPDFGMRCTVDIGKNADLLGNMQLYIELPGIQLENISNYKKFKWVDKIGLAMINFIEIEIGGYIIDRHYGDWLNIWYELTINNGIRKSFNKMIGNIDKLSEYTVSKSLYKLYIPLSFWFCLDTSLTLPLISLYNNDIKLHIEFNDIDNCYSILPSYYMYVENKYCLLKEGDIIYQQYNNSTIIGSFVYFDIINRIIYYNSIKGKFIAPTNETEEKELIVYDNNINFIINIVKNSEIIKDINYFIFNKPSIVNAYLLVNYIYLDSLERKQFLKSDMKYIIPLIQTIPEKIINSINNQYNLPLYNPVKLIVWRTILLCNKIKRCFDYSAYPFNEDELIVKNNIVLNSINVSDIDSIEYYSKIQKHHYDFYNKDKGIYLYSFSLNPKNIDLTGSVNFSKINNSFLKLTFNSIINYQNPLLIQAYAIKYGLISIHNGILTLDD